MRSAACFVAGAALGVPLALALPPIACVLVAGIVLLVAVALGEPS